MYKHLIPIMATVRKLRGKICLAFLFRVSLDVLNSLPKIKIKCSFCVVSLIRIRKILYFLRLFCQACRLDSRNRVVLSLLLNELSFHLYLNAKVSQPFYICFSSVLSMRGYFNHILCSCTMSNDLP